MRLTVRFQSGVRADAVLLAVDEESRVRVIVAGRGTTEEWLMFYGHWYDEAGRPVEVEAVGSIGEIDYERPAAMTAGSAIFS